jgi:hypothetical protein
MRGNTFFEDKMLDLSALSWEVVVSSGLSRDHSELRSKR